MTSDHTITLTIKNFITISLSLQYEPPVVKKISNPYDTTPMHPWHTTTVDGGNAETIFRPLSLVSPLLRIHAPAAYSPSVGIKKGHRLFTCGLLGILLEDLNYYINEIP
jgi:hypothetical protein